LQEALFGEKMKLIEELKELKSKSTVVNGWYPHGAEGDENSEATVRGPFCRWLKVSQVQPEYRKHVADMADDAKYAAAAMNSAPKLVAALEEFLKLEDSEDNDFFDQYYRAVTKVYSLLGEE
jgi:hypothetical protein